MENIRKIKNHFFERPIKSVRILNMEKIKLTDLRNKTGDMATEPMSI